MVAYLAPSAYRVLGVQECGPGEGRMGNSLLLGPEFDLGQEGGGEGHGGVDHGVTGPGGEIRAGYS